MSVRNPERDRKIRAARLRGELLDEWDQNYLIRCLDAPIVEERTRMPLQYSQQLYQTVVRCAHCGEIFRGDSQALTWFAAKAHVDTHQIKTYRYAPELKPGVGIETGVVEQEPTTS